MLSPIACKEETDRVLRQIYARYIKEARAVHPLFGDLLSEMSKLALRGGKRLRPYLAYLAYTGAGGTDLASFFPVAAALELFHFFLLAHDDIIDQDVMRYGGPNIAGVYQAKTGNLQAAMAAALLAGDTASSLARFAIHGTAFGAATRLAILEAFERAQFAVCGGELLDSLAPILGEQSTKERIMATYTNKTAIYSFELPLEAGLLLAGTHSDKLTPFALPIGIAYQMQDDYLGLFGAEKITGKPALSDVREGKQTYLYNLMQERATKRQKEHLALHYGNPKAGQESGWLVQAIAETCGAKAELQAEISRLSAEALGALAASTLSNPVKNALTKLVQSLITRVA